MSKREDIFKFKAGELPNYTLRNHGRDDRDGIIQPIGEGGTGVVYKAHQKLHGNIGIDRAIKFFMYRDDIAEKKPAHSFLDGNTQFLEEIKNISSVAHENLLSIISAGIHNTANLKDGIPYIVTNYINGPTLRQIIDPENDKEQNSHKKQAQELKNKLADKPIQTLYILIKIANAINYLHDNKIYHCDIAPKNIFIDNSQKKKILPILGDLGLAKNLNKSNSKIYVAGSKSFMPENVSKRLDTTIDHNEFKQLQPYWDLYAFAKTGMELLKVINKNKQPWIKPLEADFKQIIEKKSEIKSISKLLERLEFLQPRNRVLAGVQELSSDISLHRMLMPVEYVSISKRISKLTKHPALTRLINVPQLTIHDLSFPGANHTRYEHSLGVMETTRKYLVALLSQASILEHLNVGKIETALICALMHNITRFPLSNLFHEIKWKNNEDLNEFSRENLLKEIEKTEDKYGKTIKQQISDEFQSVKYDSVINILLGNESKFDDSDHFIYSLLNSSLGSRVIDFVRRDSLHLGLNKGDIFDIEDLLPHLTIIDHKLALKIKGTSKAEQIISLRYWLFQRIYWNNPTRNFCSMVRTIILDLSRHETFSNQFSKEILKNDQKQILNYLLEFATQEKFPISTNIATLLCHDSQQLYKSILDLGQSDRPDAIKICKKIANMNYTQIFTLEENLSSYLWKKLPNNPCDKDPIKLVIIDIPFEPRNNKLGEDIIVLKENKTKTYLKEFSGLINGINTDFESRLQRLRIFMHPEHSPKSLDELGELAFKWLENNV